MCAAALPAALPTTPPSVLLIICPAVEFPIAVLAPAATPEPILAPKIDSPAAINPAVPPIKYASPAADAPPVSAAAPILPAKASMF